MAQAWVDRFGVAGDGHNDRTVHGGPHRAVCLFSIEAIQRLQADGHPVEPGSVGENLTTNGIEWSLLPVGTRARIGDKLLLEVASTAGPCATQRPNFIRGRFSRISIDLFPADARMYARVLEDGPVAAGDPIELLPVAPDSRAQDELELDRLDWIVAKSALAEWRVLADMGKDIEVVDDGELVMGAVLGEPRSFHNHAYGLARLPNLVGEAAAFYERAQTRGCVIAEEAPWPGATPDAVMDVFAAEPAEVEPVTPPRGLEVTRITDDCEGWRQVRLAVSAERSWDAGPDSQGEFARRLAANSHTAIVLAMLDGAPVGTAWLYTGHKTGWLRGAAVIPEARGRGVHRALIDARARIAAEAGCDLIGSWAIADSTSAHNLAALGFRRVGRRKHYGYVPSGVDVAVG